MDNEFEEFLKREGVEPEGARKKILETIKNWVMLKVGEEVSKRITAFEKTPAEWFDALNKKIDRIKYGFSRIEMAPGIGVGVGDMLKSTYDTDDDGVVDNSEKLEGKTLTQVRDHAPKAHAASHKDGGDDELDASELAGALGTDGQVLKSDGAAANWEDDIASITFVIDGGGSAITTGEKGHLRIPFDCEIQRVTLLADQVGSIVIDIWKDTYANFPPTDADSITASAPPTISSAQKSEDTTLTGWTKTINAGDVLAFNVDSAATITRVTIALKVKKT